jgi:hypothetical protein
MIAGTRPLHIASNKDKPDPSELHEDLVVALLVDARHFAGIEQLLKQVRSARRIRYNKRNMADGPDHGGFSWNLRRLLLPFAATNSTTPASF